MTCQAVVDESADEASEFNRKEAQKVNAESKRLIEESGGTKIVVPTKEERQSFEGHGRAIRVREVQRCHRT